MGQDLCHKCGRAVGVFAATETGALDAAIAGGTRRRPGEASTFTRLTWLPYAVGAAMGAAVLIMIGGIPGAIAAPVMALIAYGICRGMQVHFERMG